MCVFEDSYKRKIKTKITIERIMATRYEERPKISRNDGLVSRYGRVGFSVGSVHAILKEDFGMRRVCAKFVLRLLSDDQMECRKTVAGDLFEQSTQDPRFGVK
jgi:hypothetical protein